MTPPSPLQRHEWRVAAFEFAVTGSDSEARLAGFLMDAVDALEDAEIELRGLREHLEAVS